MNNETQGIEKHLTSSAREELEKILLSERSKLLNKAEKIAKNQKRGQIEISLRDIIEANDRIVNESEQSSKYIKKLEIYKKVLFYSGIIYALLGMLIYFFQNRTFSFKEDSGLVIALTGVIISLTTFLLIENSMNRVKLKGVSTSDSSIDNKDNALIIVGRWMVIEKMLSKIISNQTDTKVTSFNQIIQYLNSDDFDPQMATTIKNLLKTRNAVIHNQLEASDSLVKGYTHLAGSVIEKLEHYHALE